MRTASVSGRVQLSKGFGEDSPGAEWQVHSDPQINFVSLYIKGVRDLFNLK